MQANDNAAIAPPASGPDDRSGARRRAVAHFLWICLQLVLALAVVYQFQLESRSFFHVAVLMVCGFVVHALIPLRFRQPFFAALSVASVLVVLGAGAGLRFVAIGALLIGLCHLPLRFATRVALLAAAGLFLAALRIDAVPWLAPLGDVIPAAGWAILGSMFMFRIAVYMAALRARTPDDPAPTLSRTAAYFFMAPNVTFPLFPVVDYNQFARNYYDRPALEIYQTGAKWIARGLVHLLLYRLVYRELTADASTLRDLGDVLQFLLATYLLYLRVSGSFHLIVGLLNLFGYHLPETHHLYYLADSFTDYWRRINIYWKDFMMKLVYYPSYFRLRKLTGGDATRALVLSTALVFFSTWFLHSYQWFWLRGDFPIEATDLLFWGILGALVVWNVAREAKQGRKRAISTAREGWSWRRAARVSAMFAAICLLWSLWSAESVMAWIVMWRAATFVHISDVAVAAGVIAAWVAIAGRRWDAPAVGAATARPWYRTTAAMTTGVLLIPCALAQPAVQRLFGETGSALLASIGKDALNARDAERMRIGYYERMDAPARDLNEPWDPALQRPARVSGLWDARREREDFLGAENRPSVRLTSAGFPPVSLNRWGMRGSDVAEAKPVGTVRVAFLGPSYIFGPGVPDSSTMPALVAQRLNERSSEGGPRFEALNFGVAGTSIAQSLAMLDSRAYRFSPDVVVVGVDRFVHSALTRHLLGVVRNGVRIPYSGLSRLLADCGLEMRPVVGLPVPFEPLRSLARAAGIPARMPKAEIEQRIMMCDDRIAAWALAEIAAGARARGVVPIAAAIDLVHEGPVVTTPKQARVLADAMAAGFVVVDARDVWIGKNPREVQYVAWDNHPGEYGNRLLADRLVEEMSRRDVLAPRPAR